MFRTRHVVGFPRLLRVALVAGFCTLAAAASAEECPQGNLVPRAAVSGAGVRGHVRTLADQLIPEEGTPWSAASAVVLTDQSAFVRIDFGTVLPITALLMQADADDTYVVEGSLEDVEYFPLSTVYPTAGNGLKSSGAQFDVARVRFLRIHAQGGDGNFAVSELVAMCTTPKGEALQDGALASRRSVDATRNMDKMQVALKAGGWSKSPRRPLSFNQLLAIKFTTAFLGLGLFMWGWVLRCRERFGKGGKFRDAALAILGIVSALCWWNLGSFNSGKYLHSEDLFHYFVGAKYFRELGYDGLYACAAVADADAGFGGWVRRRAFRDLRTNEIVSGEAILKIGKEYRSNYSPERWREFERDLAWFRTITPPDRWAHMMRDHGYNPTPAWGMTGRLLTRNLAASASGMLALALIDPLLLVALWGVLVWAAGWRAAAVAAIWWGTNLPAGFGWTGGSFLRQDWLLLTVLGACLARRGFWIGAGGTLAGATLLRIYPGFLAAGLGLKAVSSMWRRRSFAPERNHWRFATGFLAATLFIVALSSVADPRGVGSWGEFAANSRVDMAKSGTNQVGLATLLSFDPKRTLRKIAAAGDTNPVKTWEEEKVRVLASRRWLQVAALLAYACLFLSRMRSAEDWEALVLGIGFIPFVTAVSSYYTAIFLLFGLLWATRKEAVAAPLAALAAWTQLTMIIWGPEGNEEYFFGISIGIVIAIVLITALRWPSSEGNAPLMAHAGTRFDDA